MTAPAHDTNGLTALQRDQAETDNPTITKGSSTVMLAHHPHKTRRLPLPGNAHTLDDLEQYADREGLDFFELLFEYATMSDLYRLAQSRGGSAVDLLPSEEFMKRKTAAQ